ncbi:unnamed protein product [Oikopleura dioica]|uniref:Uncharacterized protein n=1 Tax=Oikopleura dioica TaxID=34765 RepID=E4WQG3_OIKDI|nr:unnamed protein product [Oikopleura dioica]
MIPKFFQAPARNLMPKEILKMRKALPTCRVKTQEKPLNTALNSKLRTSAPPKPQRKKKSNPLDKESLGGLKFRELMALVGSKSEKNSALIAELIMKNGR